MSDDYAGPGVPIFGPPLVECPHFGRMIIEGECTICSGSVARRAAEQHAALRTFPAKFESQCPACNLPIVVGQMISWRPDEPTVHEDCAT